MSLGVLSFEIAHQQGEELGEINTVRNTQTSTFATGFHAMVKVADMK